MKRGLLQARIKPFVSILLDAPAEQDKAAPARAESPVILSKNVTCSIVL